MRLTDRTIAALQAPERGQKLITDDILPGFGIRVSQGGAKTFVLTYGTDRRRVSLGRYGIVTLQAARERARTILAEEHLGIVHKPSPTFAAVRDEYLARRDGEVRASTRQADTYLFKRFDGLDKRKLADITPEVIESILDAIDAPASRRSAFVRLSGLMSYAVRKGYLERSPMGALETPPDQPPRHRVLSDAELAKVLITARLRRLAGDHYGAIVELLIYTGQRKMQIASLRPSMVNFETDTIQWEPDQMKTHKRHVISMGAHVRSILEPLKPKGIYFPNSIGQPFCGWSYHFRKLCADIGFSDWVIHDLRRALATRWQDLGVEIAVTERMLSHSAVTGGLVGIYQRSSYLAQMRAAVEKWERHLGDLVH